MKVIEFKFNILRDKKTEGLIAQLRISKVAVPVALPVPPR